MYFKTQTGVLQKLKEEEENKKRLYIFLFFFFVFLGVISQTYVELLIYYF